MKPSRRFWVVFLTLSLALILGLLNRDLFHFEYHDPFERDYTPESDSKNIIYLGDEIALKPGKYRLILSGNFPDAGSGIIIIGKDGKQLLDQEFIGGDRDNIFDFELSEQPQPVRVCLNYDPVSGPVHISHICIESGHVLYKQSLLTHGFPSLCAVIVYVLLMLRILAPEFFFKLFPYLSDPAAEWSLLALVLLTILVSLPVFRTGTFFLGEDTLFHLSRLKGVAADLKNGIFPPRIELFWLDDVGYGVGFFYPEIFLIIPAFFLLIGFPLLFVYKGLWLVIVFCMLFTHFWSVKQISGGKNAAGISAAIFAALAVYRLQNQYARDGLGEAFAFIFLPLIAAGLFMIFQRRANGWIVLAAGCTGTLLSHTLSFILAVIVMALFLLTRVPRMLRQPSIIAGLLKAAVLSVGLSAFFLFPMLEQKFGVPDLKINQVTSGKLDMSYAATTQSLANVLLFFQPDSAVEKVYFYPGWALLSVPLIGAVLYFGFADRSGKSFRAANVMCIWALLLLFVSTDIFPWNLFQSFLNDIQFTWRWIQSAVVLLCMAGGIYMGIICDRYKSRRVLMIQLLVCLIPAVPILISFNAARLHDQKDFYLANTHTYGSEYMPPDLTRKYILGHIDVVEDAAAKARFSGFSRNALSLSFSYVRDEEGPVNFVVPFIYYRGYAAEFIDKEGNHSEASADAAPNGFVQVSTEAGTEGTVRVWYKGTLIQTAGNAVTLSVIILCLIFLFISHRKKCNMYR